MVLIGEIVILLLGTGYLTLAMGAPAMAESLPCLSGFFGGFSGDFTEEYSTQACSCCGSISVNSPKGREGLVIREWTCPDCGALHDRDVNAARNILALGHERLAGGIPRF